ncbi:hypothetical protein [Streptomyces sp. TBY4]|uniref:hypothetical protein n=1 Tax=Streptomyces sp. TBY4 TaxID=2962030 RepID=UPI0020B8DB8B|nr:hypothetical protein [Streptomyces sp. TBY4]MCP3758194.1 hypothetical protein [Streptomyces sp. TBY4]
MPDLATPTPTPAHEPQRLRIATGRVERHGGRTLILCTTTDGVSVTAYRAVTR